MDLDDNEILEIPDANDMEDISTMRDFDSIPIDEFPPQLQRDLYKHQYQTIYKCLEAENLPPIDNERGSFYARVGINANNPGSGKTAAMLGLAFYDVPETEVGGELYASSLTAITLRSIDREYIPCSVYMADLKLTQNWKRDCDDYYGKGHWFEIGTSGELFEQASRSSGRLRDIIESLALLKKEITSAKRRFGAASQEVIDLTDENLELTKEKENLGRDLVNDYIIKMMKKYRVIICGHTNFQFLIPVFEEVQVDRLVIDELQDISITKQDTFRGVGCNPVLEYMLKNRKGVLNYREASPARFIWIVTATPYLIEGNEKTKGGSTHYFNSWIGKNAPFIRDYINSGTGNYILPEMIYRYVIKFPDYYINNNIYGGKNFVRYYNLKCKKPREFAAIQGALGNAFDEFLENDDYDGLMKKLSIDNPEDIIDAVKAQLYDQIDAIRKTMSEYKAEGVMLEKLLSDRENDIAEIEAKITAIDSKLESFKGAMVEDCAICYESLQAFSKIPPENEEDKKIWDEKSVVACKSCFKPFHTGCLFQSFSISHNHTCPNCRAKLDEETIIRVTDDDGEVDFKSIRNEEEQIKDETTIFENKQDALREVLGQCNKALLYLNTSGEYGVGDIEIIKMMAEMGIDVRIPSTMTKEKKVNVFGEYAARIITPRAKRQIAMDLDDFKKARNPTVWVLKTSHSSSGLNFPFIDSIICYSKFKEEEQIKGRALRPQRTEPFNYVVIEYEDV